MKNKVSFLLEICHCQNKPKHCFIQKLKGEEIINEVGPCFSQDSLIEMIRVWNSLGIISSDKASILTREVQFSIFPEKKIELETFIERLYKYQLLKEDNFYDCLIHNENNDINTKELIKGIVLNLSMNESIKNAEEELDFIMRHNFVANA